MRKISKLLLLVITIVSLSCVLFYKYQYEKLYNVLEVLEFFGTPDNRLPSRQLELSVYRPPAWQTLSQQNGDGSNDIIMVYSAFCARSFDSDDSCPLVKVVALASSSFDRQKVTCQLWYEDTMRPTTAMFMAEELKPDDPMKANSDVDKDVSPSSKTKLTPYLFTCESKFSALQPFGVSLFFEDKSQNTFTHVEAFRSPDSLKTESDSLPLTVCLRPQETRSDATQSILENVLIHKSFGVHRFFVYDSSLTSKFVEVVSKPEFSWTFRILPWNLPDGLVDSLTSQILIQTDCHFRSAIVKSGAIILNTNQILTPTSGSLAEVLKDPARNGKLELEVRRFCAEFEAELPPRSGGQSQPLPPTALQQLLYSDKFGSKMFMTFKLGPASDVVKVSPDHLSIHDYGSCGFAALDLDKSQMKKDPTMKNFSAKILAILSPIFAN